MQTSFADLEYDRKKKVTRRDRFLADIEAITPWSALVAELEGQYPKGGGRGRALDNVFVERLWWTVKYEDVYLRGYETPAELETGLHRYFRFYNEQRPPSALDRLTPAEVHWTSQPDP